MEQAGQSDREDIFQRMLKAFDVDPDDQDTVSEVRSRVFDCSPEEFEELAGSLEKLEAERLDDLPAEMRADGLPLVEFADAPADDLDRALGQLGLDRYDSAVTGE